MIGPSTTSDEKSASASITTRPSFLHGFELNPPATGYATIKVYDSEDSSVSGKKLIATAACSAGLNSIYLELPTARVANRGIYVVLSGTTTYNVAFSLG